MALGLVWLGGAVALQAPRRASLRDDVQRSSILRALNDVLPPSGPILNALARFDPFPRIDGPPADVRRAAGGDRPRPRRAPAAAAQRGQDPRDGVRARRRGLGLGRRATGIVVTNAHVVAGPDTTPTVQLRRRRAAARRDGRSPSTRTTTSRCCASRACRRARCRSPPSRGSGRLGRDPRLPARTGPTTSAPRAWASTRGGDHPGRLRARPGAAARSSPLRGTVRPGNSGGPMVDASGRVRRHGLRRRPRSGPARRATASPTTSVARAASRAPAPTGRHRSLRGRDAGCATLRRPWPRRSSSPRSRPSGRDLARVLPGPVREAHRHRGEDRALARGPDHVITWAVGHLVQLAEPDEYDDEVQEVADGRPADRARRASSSSCATSAPQKQMTVVTRAAARATTSTLVVNACDAGREGELIFAYLYEKASAKKPVQRLWLSSMTNERDARGVRAACAPATSSHRSRRPRARARRPTGSSA